MKKPDPTASTYNIDHYFNLFKRNTFIEDNDISISFFEFKNKFKNMAKKFSSFGIKKNDYIFIQIENNIDSALTLFALSTLGAIPCFVSSRVKDVKLHYSTFGVPFKFLLTQEILNQIKNLEPNNVELEFKPSNLKIVLWTSGSSSLPKAALLTFENLIWNAMGANDNIAFIENDYWHWSLPIYHVGGISILFRALINGGAVTLKPQQATHVSWVQTQLYRWLQTNMAPPKSILLGGSSISPDLIQRCLDLKLSIHKSYGMTEMCSQICTTHNNTELYTSGQLLNYRELKIKDGEIFVKGPSLFQGYISNGELKIPFDNEGWFATKDLGRMTPDGLIVTGRKDRMFVSAGENIQPESIEQAILSYPGVVYAKVIPFKNLEYGFKPHAYVESRHEIDPVALKNFLKDRLTGIQMPEKFFKYSELPYSFKSLKD